MRTAPARSPVYSRTDTADAWTSHAEGVLTHSCGEPVDSGLAAWPPAGAKRLELDTAYADLADRGHDYGPVFRGLTGLWRRGAEVFAEVRAARAGRAC